MVRPKLLVGRLGGLVTLVTGGGDREKRENRNRNENTMTKTETDRL